MKTIGGLDPKLIQQVCPWGLHCYVVKSVRVGPGVKNHKKYNVPLVDFDSARAREKYNATI